MTTGFKQAIIAGKCAFFWAVPVSQIGGLYEQQQWVGLQTVVMVVRIRHLWNKTTREVQFYLSSLPCDALRIGRAIRQHWGIENQLHWVLDVTNGYGCIPHSQRSWS